MFSKIVSTSGRASNLIPKHGSSWTSSSKTLRRCAIDNNAIDGSRTIATFASKDHHLSADSTKKIQEGFVVQYYHPYYDMQQQEQQLVQRRWRKAAKMSQYLKDLDERAHSVEHERAVEKRKKQKEKTAKRKNKKNKNHPSKDSDDDSTAAATNFTTGMDDFADDFNDDHDDDDDDEEEENEDGVVALPNTNKMKSKMTSIIDKFQEVLKSVRGTEPSPDIFETIPVDAYGETSSLKSVAQVVIVGPTEANITCYDPSLVKEVKKSIVTHLGMNPDSGGGAEGDMADASVIRVYIPKVSLETRQQTVKQLNKRAEAFRVRIRKVRQRSMNTIKLGKEGKLDGISKDDAFRVSKEIDALTEKMIQQVDSHSEKKQKMIMGQ